MFSRAVQHVVTSPARVGDMMNTTHPKRPVEHGRKDSYSGVPRLVIHTKIDPVHTRLLSSQCDTHVRS